MKTVISSIKMKFIAVVLALFACANALESEVSLKDRIVMSLESFSENQAEVEIENQAMGVENCENKCNNVFNRLAYQISTDPNSPGTYEWTACVKGCSGCAADLAAKASKTKCFTDCKNYDWKGNNILKGVIEPDKACIAGCIIQTCQGVCIGGTVDPPNKKNTKLFWPNGGCSIKTEPYSQQSEYVPYNAPIGPPGANLEQCCSNALSLCLYAGNKSSANFAQLLANTGSFCSDFVPSKTEADICNFYHNAANCGSL